MAENSTERAETTPRGPADALRAAMAGLHREIGQQHKALMESQGLMNTTMARELMALRTLITESGKTGDVMERVQGLRLAQRAQGRRVTALLVGLWLGMLLGFSLMLLWR